MLSHSKQKCILSIRFYKALRDLNYCGIGRLYTSFISVPNIDHKCMQNITSLSPGNLRTCEVCVRCTDIGLCVWGGAAWSKLMLNWKWWLENFWAFMTSVNTSAGNEKHSHLPFPPLCNPPIKRTDMMDPFPPTSAVFTGTLRSV